MNQAIALSETDNGNREWWYQDVKGAQTDEDGNIIEGSSEAEKWFRKYLAPYLNNTEIKAIAGGLYVYFADGSALRIPTHTTRDWLFFATGDKCIKKPIVGVCYFAFNYAPSSAHSSFKDWKYATRNFEPWFHAWNGTKEQLYEDCSKGQNLCSRLIMLNGWKIPKDYPLKF